MEQKFDRWEFIEKWLPDYDSNQDVAYSNDLSCYIHGETENSQYYRLKEQFPDVDDAIIEQEAVDAGLYTEAYNHYMEVKANELEEKRQEAEDARLSYLVDITLTLRNSQYLAVKADSDIEACEIAKRRIAQTVGPLEGYYLKEIEVNTIGII